MPQLKPNRFTNSKILDSKRKLKVGGVAALIVGIIFRRYLGAEEIVKSEK